MLLQTQPVGAFITVEISTVTFHNCVRCSPNVTDVDSVPEPQDQPLLSDLMSLALKNEHG